MHIHTHETTTVKGIRTVLSPFSVLDLILDLRRSWTRVRWLPRNHRVGMAGVYWVSMTGHDRIFWLKYHSWRTMGLMGFFYFLLGIFKANFSIDQTSLIRWQMHKLFWVHKWFCRSCLTNPPCKGWDTEFWARPIQDVPISSQFLSKCLSEDIRRFCSIDFPTWQPQFVTRFPNVVVSTGGLSTKRLPKKNRWLHHVSMHFPCIFHAFSMDFPCIFHGLSADGHILLPMPSILSAVSGRGGGLRPPLRIPFRGWAHFFRWNIWWNMP